LDYSAAGRSETADPRREVREQPVDRLAPFRVAAEAPARDGTVLTKDLEQTVRAALAAAA
jgi:hypothetical protein